MDSRVNELLQGLQEEEKRLKAELAAAEKRVRELRSQIGKVRSGLKGLNGASPGGKRRSRRSGGSEPEGSIRGAVDFSPPSECSEVCV